MDIYSVGVFVSELKPVTCLDSAVFQLTEPHSASILNSRNLWCSLIVSIIMIITATNLFLSLHRCCSKIILREVYWDNFTK